MFAVAALEYVTDMATYLWIDESLASKSRSLARDIQRGIRDYAVVLHPEYGRTYAPVRGGRVQQPPANGRPNVPSLLSIPYLGFTTTGRCSTTRGSLCCPRTTRTTGGAPTR